MGGKVDGCRTFDRFSNGSMQDGGVEGWRGGGVEGCMALHVWFVGLFDRKRVELGELRHGRDGA